MTLNRIAKTAALVALVSASSLGFADTQNLVVTASVTGVCKLTNVPNLVFGPIDPSSVGAGGVNASTTVTYKCTKGTAATALSASALSDTMSDGTNTLAFSITLPGVGTLSAGTGFSSSAAATTFAVTGNIAQAAAQDAVASAGYTKTLTLTLAP